MLLQIVGGGGANTVYRRAILKAIESLNDFQSRSSIDLVRRHTQDILEDHSWNDKLFLLTFKSIIRHGDVDLYPHVSAELSPTYKRKRAESLLRRVDEAMEDAPAPPSVPMPIEPPPPIVGHRHASAQPKLAPKRKPEHDKWKIIPKKIYDKTM